MVVARSRKNTFFFFEYRLFLIFYFRLSTGSYGHNSATGYVVLVYGAAGLSSVDLNSFIGQFIMGTTAGKSYYSLVLCFHSLF
jgi:hypothetical protein